jgi:hypothetical protein
VLVLNLIEAKITYRNIALSYMLNKNSEATLAIFVLILLKGKFYFDPSPCPMSSLSAAKDLDPRGIP